jgi:hypothetical protein
MVMHRHAAGLPAAPHISKPATDCAVSAAAEQSTDEEIVASKCNNIGMPRRIKGMVMPEGGR